MSTITAIIQHSAAAGTSAFWQDLQEVEPSLHGLASLIPGLLLADKAESTTRNYWAAFKRWSRWAECFHLPSFPAKAPHVALYMVHIHQTSGSAAAVSQLSAALRWLHEKADVPNPMLQPTVQQLRAAIRRACSRPVNRRNPLSPQQFRTLMAMLTTPAAPLSDLQCATLIALGFTAFLRWDDLSCIQMDDLEFTRTHLQIFLPKRKNDQFREGQYIVVARSNDKATCPVAVVERFLIAGRHGKNDKLFRRVIAAPVRGDYLTGEMSYTRARELLLHCLERAGFDSTGYGTHSLRSGGATAAANAGVADRLLQHHGGWRCPSSWHCYIKESLEGLLSVSRSVLQCE